jgi:predicted 2-oxoglutarate/Fe(II)-dependent dioxygenase YbiX
MAAIDITNMNRVAPLVEADGTPDPVNRDKVYPDLSANPDLLPVENLWQYDPAPTGMFAQTQLSSERPLTIDPRYDAPAPAPATLAAPTSIMGMFPEVDAMQRALYQQKQNEAMQAQAMQYARLDPMQQAQYSLYMGGQQLGGAIGGALGGVDPQLQLISMRNAISKQINMRDPESYFKAATLANQAGDREFATSLVDAGTKIESTMSQVELRKAQAQKAKNAQQAQTDSAQKRAAVSDLEQKLATDPTYKPTAQEIASVRWIVANESKNRTQIDPVTGQLYIIEGLNIQDAAPNIANYLKQTGTTVPATTPALTTEAQATTEAPAPAGTPVAKGVTAVPTEASKIKAQEEADKKVVKAEELKREAEGFQDGLSAIQVVRGTIKETKALVSKKTTGYGSLLSFLPESDAMTVSDNTQTIKDNIALAKLKELKQHSKTGASGLGALNMKEFDAIQGIIARLNPKSANYANDLQKVDDFFARAESLMAQQGARAEERANKPVAGTTTAPSGAGDKEARIKATVDRAMADSRTKGTRAQVESAVRARPEFK